MHFTKIKIGKDEDVELGRIDVRKHSKDVIETPGINPLPSFKDAVSAFLPLFLRVVPWLDEVKDHVRVSTLSLGEKDGDRSLQISAVLSIDACNGAGISMTTPRITTPPEGAQDDQVHLTPAELRLIETVESEAERYVNGETAQGDVFASESENATAFKERAASASADTTRKPHDKKRGGKKGAAAPATDAPLGAAGLRNFLLTVDCNVPLEKVEAWTTEERAEAQAYGATRQQEILDQATVVAAPPTCVLRDAVKSAQADDWTTAPPPKIDDVAAEKVRTAVESGVTPLHVQ